MNTECIGDCVKLNGKVYPCTISLTLDLVGGKWKAVILYHLRDKPKRYNELHKEMPTVTEMTLSLQLKKLEKDGLVKRKVYGKKPPIKVIYSLTDFGKSFVPVLEAITEWGNQAVSENGEFLYSSLGPSQ
ncbi:transcriptional regulator, HxlR family [Flagellimonas taeanensis]|uniref:Transcriptional regulator, HxlR family n=1 Tax=Flagellimonas taeanensis TaxID=1005926 RepID=A0A1M6UIW5_9FLAO|nr:helix-turn-helix domain-containing protein [Allomuricauda taeanensis]SFC55828.1 transcriptional regulator, HxlR family [Allomuricauda taeanensis]SHK69106.1 transcriptional regulator, HxlR family [Allomuricauda taeanensis]